MCPHDLPRLKLISLLVIVVGLGHAAPAATIAAPPAPASPPGITLNFDRGEVELSVLIRVVAEPLGIVILHDERVRGKKVNRRSR